MKIAEFSFMSQFDIETLKNRSMFHFLLFVIELDAARASNSNEKKEYSNPQAHKYIEFASIPIAATQFSNIISFESIRSFKSRKKCENVPLLLISKNRIIDASSIACSRFYTLLYINTKSILTVAVKMR